MSCAKLCVGKTHPQMTGRGKAIGNVKIEMEQSSVLVALTHLAFYANNF